MFNDVYVSQNDTHAFIVCEIDTIPSGYRVLRISRSSNPLLHHNDAYLKEFKTKLAAMIFADRQAYINR